jgi:uncharacterized membrane protein (DUF4010 family)
MDFVFIKQLVVSLGLGLLVGFQREWGPPHVAGIRSFALIAVLGTVCARLAVTYGGWIISAGLIAVTALVIAGGIAKYYSNELTPGITTGAAALLIYAVGALVVGHLSAAIIVGGVTAVLLHWKKPLHALVKKASEKDIHAIIQLVLIALVILPILPNRSYGPYEVLNPFHIWLMVVLIVGISLGGYVASRFVGAGAGATIAGILGGIISSTATTASFSKHSRENAAMEGLSAFVILVASTIAFFRVAFEIGVVAPRILPRVLPQLMAMTALMAVLCGVFYWVHLRHRSWDRLSAAAEPSNMKVALVFGLLYAVILFAVAAAKERFGHSGMYVIAGLSGLTDMDAITLSTTQLLKQQRIDIETGWRMIIIGALSNLVFKGAIAAALGNRQLTRHVGVYFGLGIIGGACMIAFWP